MVKGLITDGLAVVGAASLIAGVAMMYVPAAYIIAGLMALSLSVLGAKRWAS